ENTDFVPEIVFQTGNFLALDQLGPFVLLGSLSRKDFDIDDNAFDARRADQRGIAHVTGLFTKDGAQQLFFGGELRFALGRDLSDENVPGLYVRTDPDDACLIKIFQERLTDIRDIPGDFLRPEFGIARLDFEFFNMD